MAAQVVLRLINEKLTWALVRTCRILLEHLHTTEHKNGRPHAYDTAVVGPRSNKPVQLASNIVLAGSRTSRF